MTSDTPLISFKNQGITVWHSAELIPYKNDNNYGVPRELAETRNVGDTSPNKNEDAIFNLFMQGRIENKIFIEPIRLTDNFSNKQLILINCRFRSIVDLSSTQLTNTLTIENCIFENGLKLENIQLAGGLYITNSTVLASNIGVMENIFNLSGLNAANIKIENIYCSGASDFSKFSVRSELEFVNLYNLGNVSFKQSLMSASAFFASFPNNSGQYFIGGYQDMADFECRHLGMYGLEITDDLSLWNAKMTGGLLMTSIPNFQFIVRRNLLLDSLQAKYINIGGISIIGDFSATNSTLNKFLRINPYLKQIDEHSTIKYPTTIHGSLNFKSLTCGEIELNGVEVNNYLDFSNAKLSGKLELKRTKEFELKIGGYAVFLNLQAQYIDVGGITVKGEFSLNNATVEEYIQFASFDAENEIHPTKIGYWQSNDPNDEESKLSLSLYGATVKHGFLAFMGVDIAGDLLLNFAKVGTGIFFRSTIDYPCINQIGGSLVLDNIEAPKLLTLEGLKIEGDFKGISMTVGSFRILPTIIKNSVLNTFHIQCSEIKGFIDLPQAKLQDCEIAGLKVAGKTPGGISINMKQAKVDGNVSFFTSWKEIKDRLLKTYQGNRLPNQEWQIEELNVKYYYTYLENTGAYVRNTKKIEALCRTGAESGITLKSGKIEHDLKLSCLQCSDGAINLDSINVGGDLSIVTKFHKSGNISITHQKAHAQSFTADSAQIGDDMDVTGLKLSGDFSAQKITVGGRLSFFKQNGSGLLNEHTEIKGKLDLEAARKIGVLTISDESFQDDPPNNQLPVILKQAYIERLDVLYDWVECNCWEIDKEKKSFPRPVDLDYITVKYWDFQEKSNARKPFLPHRQKASDDYIGFLENSTDFQRHTYRAVEDTLLNQGLDDQADAIHVAMWEKYLHENKKAIKGFSFSWIPWLFNKVVYGMLMKYGTSANWLIGIVLVWCGLSSYLFSIPTNITPTNTAVLASEASAHNLANMALENEKPKKILLLIKDSHPPSSEWDWKDGILVALRYHIPIIALDAHEDWQPSDNQDTSINPQFNLTPEAYATIVAIGHWILLPVIVFTVSRKILRKRGAG